MDIYVYIYIYIYINIQVYMDIYVCVHIYIYTHLYTHICMDMFICHKLYLYMCICMAWIYHTFSDSYVYESLGMQSENPTPEEAGKASSRHSSVKSLQARQKNYTGVTQKAQPSKTF